MTVSQGLDVVVRNIGGTIYVARKAQVKKLNGLGAEIWRRCTGELTAPQIAEAIHQEYNAPLAEIQDDVDSFLAALAQGGFVEFTKTED